ncbi:toll/interleukin-1 receptor domain-containing protein [Mesorhizobium sp. RCC_202]|uniref:toll/interleukin-1 receptor domain-containing protein n=1 Tax=Mesorhizobium sp. RCC_202 TaxID=3239222 RepID=UPI0035233887
MAKQAKASKEARTFVARFIDALTRMSGPEGTSVNGNTLRDELGWADVTFNRTKAVLRRQGKIRVSPGRGGQISLVQPSQKPKPKPLKAFISYSHADVALKAELIKHLSPLKRAGLIDAWHDEKIEAGEKWAEAIAKNLETAEVVVLLVSVDFINSDYCNTVELTRALQREQEKSLVVIPVIARECLWKYEPFSQFQAALGGKAISSFPDRDDGLTQVAEAIKTRAEALRKAKEAVSS